MELARRFFLGVVTPIVELGKYFASLAANAETLKLPGVAGPGTTPIVGSEWTGDTKDSRSHHSGSSVTAAASAPLYDPQGYHYPITTYHPHNSGWSSGGTSSMGMASSQAPSSPAARIQSYGSSYAPSSHWMPRSEQYLYVDEYEASLTNSACDS